MTRNALFAASLYKTAKANGREIAKSIEFWFRRKYNLPPSDPRFLECSIQDMLTDHWAHHFYDNPKAEEEVVDEDFDIQAEIDRMAQNPDDWEPV